MSAREQRKVVRSELVRRAKALGLNISEAVDAALEEVITAADREAWLRENADAIEAYNEGVEQRDVFSDDWRSF